MGRLCVAVVGFGGRGRQWGEAVARSGTATLVGVAEPRPLDAGPSVPVARSLPQLLQRVRPDAVVIATPPASRVDVVRTAAEAGLPCLVEKPLALSVAEAREVADLATETGVPVVVGQNYRLRPWARTVTRSIKTEGLQPRWVDVTEVRPRTGFAAGALDLSGGALWDVGIHHLDLLRWHLGQPASVRCRQQEEGGVQTCTTWLHWPAGVAGQYRLVVGGRYFHHREWLEGGEAGIEVSDRRVSVIRWDRRPRRARVLTLDPEGALLRLLAGVAGGRPAPRWSARDNVETVELVAACVRSLQREGEPVALTSCPEGEG